jgi:hypothetical protein
MSLLVTMTSVAMVLAGQPALGAPTNGGTVTTSAVPRSFPGASVGAFSPWAMSARSDTQSGLVRLQGGFDGGRRNLVFEQLAEGRLIGRLSLRGGFSWFENGGGPSIGLKLDTLRQESHGIDLALATIFESQGFNRASAIAFEVSGARRLGDLTLLTALAYSQGLKRGERSAAVHLSARRPVGRRLHIGLDSRLRLDLEPDPDQPADETEWDLVAGPTAVLSLGPFAFTATAGISAAKLRARDTAQVGALLLIGVGTMF